MIKPLSELEIAQREVRQLRLQIIDNLDKSFKPIDAQLDDELGKQLTLAIQKKIKLTPQARDTRSDMYLHAYA